MEIIPFELKGKTFIQMITLYCSIFKTEPSAMRAQFRRHYKYPDFEGYIMLNRDHSIAGYIYGYHSKRGQYYHDLLEKHLHPNKVWLKDCMELVELGVHPQHRRKGVATQLLHTLLRNRKEKTAVLTARKDNQNAITFYKRHGWVVIREGFYPNVPHEYIIMGKKMNGSV